ncbi:hypothetical protein LINPERHAP2_LOCUS34232 [Linum perenne]
MNSQSRSFIGVQILRLPPTRQRPIKPLQQASQRDLNRRSRETNPRTTSPPCSKRNQFKILSLKINRAIQKPLRPKLLRLIPVLRISPDRPRVYQHPRLRRNVVPLHRHVSSRFSRHQDRDRRV